MIGLKKNMTFKKLAEKFNLSEKDMIEVLRVMEYFKEDYSDWEKQLYDDGIVDDVNHIINPKKLEHDIVDYRDLLLTFYKSRNSRNGSNFSKITIKNGILKNKALINFLENN